MHTLISLLITAFLAVAAFSQQKAVTKSKPASTAMDASHASDALPSEEEVNAFMHVMFGYNAQLTWKIVSIKPSAAEGLAEVTVQISSPEGQGGQRFFVTADAKHAVTGEIIPFGAHPFEHARIELQKKASGPAKGPADAPVEIVEFSDLQCPHCKEANPTVEKLLGENANIHFVYQNFPLPMHNWAEKAAEYDDCVGRASNDAFWKFIDGVFAVQDQITAENADEKLTAIADQAGVKGSEIAACAARPETQARVQASEELGKSLDVNSTPTLFVNGRPVGVSGNDYDALKKLVDFSATNK